MNQIYEANTLKLLAGDQPRIGDYIYMDTTVHKLGDITLVEIKNAEPGKVTEVFGGRSNHFNPYTVNLCHLQVGATFVFHDPESCKRPPPEHLGPRDKMVVLSRAGVKDEDKKTMLISSIDFETIPPYPTDPESIVALYNPTKKERMGLLPFWV